jgi:hypothetical protein
MRVSNTWTTAEEDDVPNGLGRLSAADSLWMTPIEQLLRRSRHPENATAEGIELGAPEHLELQHLELDEVPFDRS